MSKITKDQLEEVVSQQNELSKVLNDIGTLEANKHSLLHKICLLYTSPSPRDRTRSRMPSSA